MKCILLTLSTTLSLNFFIVGNIKLNNRKIMRYIKIKNTLKLWNYVFFCSSKRYIKIINLLLCKTRLFNRLFLGLLTDVKLNSIANIAVVLILISIMKNLMFDQSTEPNCVLFQNFKWDELFIWFFCSN
jgi:hypothetical protein